MKVLFLDIDGVLNSHQSIRMEYRRRGKPSHGRNMPFCPISRANLQEVLARIPDLQIVVSSSWRIGRDLEELKEDLHESYITPRIIGMTPMLPMRGFSSPPRGAEIQAYLDDRIERGWEPVTEFAILDDNSDMAHLRPRLVQTDTRLGFMWDKAVELLEMFGHSEYAKGEGVHTLL